MSTLTTTVPDLMTTKEVADLIRKTPHAVRQMRHKGIAPKGTKVGRGVLYPRAGVLAWLKTLEQADPLAQRAA